MPKKVGIVHILQSVDNMQHSTKPKTICLKFAFAFVEASKTYSLNVFNILFKMWQIHCSGFHGYAFAFGEYNSIIGIQFFLTLDNTDMAHFFFNYERYALGAPK